eukprot:g2295.t1
MKKQGVESPTKRREGDGNLQIKCHSKSSRGREPPTLQAVKSQVERSSKLLKAVLTHDREVLGDLLIGGLSADPCVRYDHGNSVLSFHENCGEFKNEVTNGFCDSDVLECFLRFAEDPTLTSRFKENVQKLRKFIKRESIVKDEFQNSLDMELNNVADELHKKQKEEVEVSLDSLEEQRLAEIRKVNEKYDALKVQQHEVWKKTHDEQQFIVKNMFKGDSDFALRVASSKIQRKRKNILKKSVATIEEDMKSVFHYQTLVRLLVLSEYLHVEHLRDACMEQLTRAPGSYEKELILANIDSPALNSSLLDPFTIRSMIQRLSNRGLFELIAQGDLFAFCELARREYDARIRDAEDKYTQLKNDELLQLSNTLEKLKMEKQTKFRGDSWYPDLDDVPDGFTNDVVDVEDQIVEPAGWRAIPFENALLHEMQRRRSYSSVRINKDNLPSTMKLEYNGTVLSLTKPFQYATAHATKRCRLPSKFGYNFGTNVENGSVKDNVVGTKRVRPVEKVKDTVNWGDMNTSAALVMGKSGKVESALQSQPGKSLANSSLDAIKERMQEREKVIKRRKLKHDQKEQDEKKQLENVKVYAKLSSEARKIERSKPRMRTAQDMLKVHSKILKRVKGWIDQRKEVIGKREDFLEFLDYKYKESNVVKTG